MSQAIPHNNSHAAAAPAEMTPPASAGTTPVGTAEITPAGTAPAGTTEATRAAARDNRRGNDYADKPDTSPLESSEAIVAALEAAAGRIASAEKPSNNRAPQSRTTPENSTPDATAPDGMSPDAGNPEYANPDNATPDSENHHASAPDDAETARTDAQTQANAQARTDAQAQASAQVETNAQAQAAAALDAEARALMQALPPELQQRFAKRETARAMAGQALQQETLKARASHDTLLDWSNKQLDAVLSAARTAIEGDFADVDWTSLQKNNPQAFLRLDALRKERLNALVHNNAQREALRGHENRQRQEQYSRHLEQEYSAAMPAIQKLMGRNCTNYREEIFNYLKTNGAPASHIRDVSHGYQLVLVTKAMLYDKMEQARTTAARKVAEAPAVQRPKARPSESPGSAEARKWNAALEKDPHNKDALINLLLAR